MTARKVGAGGKGRITWAGVVRGTVHMIADAGQRAKDAVDAMEDNELKFTSLKSFRTFTDSLKLRIDSQSDDPVVTVRAEVMGLIGATSTDDLNRWFWDNSGAEHSKEYDWNIHEMLVKAQRYILESQSRQTV